MPSPFPGMNPYLEQEGVWHDFHSRFIPAASDALSDQVLPKYLVNVEERIYLHTSEDDDGQFAGVAGGGRAGAAGGALLADAPVSVRLPIEEAVRDLYLGIRTRDGDQIVTVIELLSPTNKRPGGNREAYLAKRLIVGASRAHLVEIDLLRGGTRMPPGDAPECDYCVLVSRYEDRPHAGFWPLRLRDALPVVPIPLGPDDPAARLDLKQVIDGIYDRAGYPYRIYRRPPSPPLGADDAAWARQFVPADL